MQHDNNIEKKLREMEAMEQPDLGQMDTHWQHMAAMMQPSVLPVKSGWPKWMMNGFYGAVAAVLIGGMVLYFSSKKNVDGIKVVNASETVLSTENIVPSTTAAVANTQIVSKPVIISSIKNNIGHSVVDGNTATITVHQATHNKDIKAKPAFLPNDNDNEEFKTDSVAGNQFKSSAELNAAMLESFFTTLKKPVQYFEINSINDTTIVCENGTNIFIPAKTFLNSDSVALNGPIEIRVKEFYNYDEIVSDKLTTVSNGELLISGGMVQIVAMQYGKELIMAPAKQMILKIPVNKPYDEEMQLFTAKQPVAGEQMDTASIVNWQPEGQFQRLKRSKFMVKIFDPHGQPYKVMERKDGTKLAKFVIRDNCTMSNKEVLTALKQRYGMFYDKITLRRSLSDNPKPLFSKKPHPVVGDSVEIEFSKAVAMNMLSKEEVLLYAEQLLKDSMAWNDKLNAIPFYQFRLNQLGYFNCDRYNNNLTRMNFSVNLPENEEIQNIFSVLTFNKFRGVVRGYSGLNKLIFANVPKGEKVHVLCIGVKEGKVVSCIAPAVTDESETELEFSEITPALFKQQLKELRLQ